MSPFFLAAAAELGLEPKAIVSGLQDVATVGQAIEQRGGHLRVAEDRGPFAEVEIRGDDHASALIEFAQQMDGGGSESSPEDCFHDDTMRRLMH